MIFPVGNLQKAEVKQIARDAGFADVAARKEVSGHSILEWKFTILIFIKSMGLCFVGRRKFSHFIKQVLYLLQSYKLLD